VPEKDTSIEKTPFRGQIVTLRGFVSHTSKLKGFRTEIDLFIVVSTIYKARKKLDQQAEGYDMDVNISICDDEKAQA
jgi:hypothetical protein